MSYSRRDDFPNNYVGDLVHRERGWVVVPPTCCPAGRNTALIQLASELPAAVLSDVLGIDIATATRWAGYAKRDWQSYLAHRHETARHHDVDTARRS